MRFQITFEIAPGGPFGVPEDGRTVLPGDPASGVGDTYHSRTLTRVGFGTLSRYRSPEDAINQPIEISGLKGHIRDTFIVLNVEADTPGQAYERAQAALESFLQHLALRQPQSFSYKPLILESEDGEKVYPIPRAVWIASVTTYNLEALRRHIEEAARFASLADARLARALQYFEHALFLRDQRTKALDPLSRHHRHLLAAIFLNLWKAVTTIIGDPSKDNDYQSRYRTYGFDYSFFQQKIERLRQLRNDYDIAHYHLSPDRLEEVQKHEGEAQSIAMEVLVRYRQYLDSSG